MKRLVLVSVLVLPLAAQAQEVDVPEVAYAYGSKEIGPGNTDNVLAWCDDGYVVVGGGFRRTTWLFPNTPRLEVWSSGLSRVGMGWEVLFHNPSSTKATGYAEAVCMGVSSPTRSDASQPQAPPSAASADVAELKTPPAAMTPADLAALRTALPAHRVSAGTSRDLDERMAARSWMIESSGIVGMAIASPCPPRPECSPSDDVLVMWYDDGTVSQTPFRSGDGGSLDPIGERQRSPYRLPPGQRPGDIVGIGISGGESVFAWYRDGTRSTGSIGDLGSGIAGERYTLPPGKGPADIVALAKAPSNGWAYAWYADGTVSAGTDADLDAHRAPYAYTLPPDVGAAEVLDMAIGHDDWVFAWYR